MNEKKQQPDASIQLIFRTYIREFPGCTKAGPKVQGLPCLKGEGCAAPLCSRLARVSNLHSHPNRPAERPH